MRGRPGDSGGSRTSPAGTVAAPVCPQFLQAHSSKHPQSAPGGAHPEADGPPAEDGLPPQACRPCPLAVQV